jgi:hypothetical protein
MRGRLLGGAADSRERGAEKREQYADPHQVDREPYSNAIAPRVGSTTDAPRQKYGRRLLRSAAGNARSS